MLAVLSPPFKVQSQRNHHNDHIIIIVSGTSGFYISKNVPTINFDLTATTITMGNASDQPHQSSGSADWDISNLPTDFPRDGKVIPFFQHNLIGLGPICNTDCKVIFTKNNVIIYDQTESPILMGW